MTVEEFCDITMGAAIVFAVGMAFALRGLAQLVWALIGGVLALLCYLLGRPCE